MKGKNMWVFLLYGAAMLFVIGAVWMESKGNNSEEILELQNQASRLEQDIKILKGRAQSCEDSLANHTITIGENLKSVSEQKEKLKKLDEFIDVQLNELFNADSKITRDMEFLSAKVKSVPKKKDLTDKPITVKIDGVVQFERAPKTKKPLLQKAGIE